MSVARRRVPLLCAVLAGWLAVGAAAANGQGSSPGPGASGVPGPGASGVPGPEASAPPPVVVPLSGLPPERCARYQAKDTTPVDAGDGCSLGTTPLSSFLPELAAIVGEVDGFTWSDRRGDMVAIDPSRDHGRARGHADLTGGWWSLPVELTDQTAAALRAAYGPSKQGAFWGHDTEVGAGSYRIIGFKLAAKAPVRAPADETLVFSLETGASATAGPGWPVTAPYAHDPWQGGRLVVEAGWFPSTDGRRAGLGETDLGPFLPKGKVDRYNVTADALMVLAADRSTGFFLVPTASLGPTFRLSSLVRIGKEEPAFDWLAGPESRLAQLPSEGRVDAALACASLAVLDGPVRVGEGRQDVGLLLTMHSPLFSDLAQPPTVDLTLVHAGKYVQLDGLASKALASEAYGPGISVTIGLDEKGAYDLGGIVVHGVPGDEAAVAAALGAELARVIGTGIVVNDRSGTWMGYPGCEG